MATAPGTLLGNKVLFAYKAGGPTRHMVYSRASVAHRVQRKGLTEQAASGVLRTSWYQDASGIWRQSTLLEAARTNLVTWSDALSNWTSAGTPVVTDAFATLGDLGLTLVEDNLTSEISSKQLAVTFTGDGVKSLLVYLRAPDTPADGQFNDVRITDTTAATIRLRLLPTWNTDGTIVLTAATVGTLLATRKLGLAGGKPVYAVYVQTTTITAANSHVVIGMPAGAGSDATRVGKLLCGGFMVENALFPSEVRQKTTGATQARAADLLTQSAAFGPVDQTWYGKMVRPIHADVSGDIGYEPTLAYRSTVNPRIGLDFGQSSRVMGATCVDAAGVFARSRPAIPAGSVLEVLGQFKDLATAPKVAADVGNGLTTFTAAGSGFSAFGSQTLAIPYSGSNHFSGGLIALGVVEGLHSLATMQQIRTPVGVLGS